MNTRTLIASVILATCSAAAMAEEGRPYLECTRSAPEFNLPQICVWRGTPPAPQPAPVSKPDNTLQQANRYADRGDKRTLQQAQAYADAGDARTLNAATQHTTALVTVLQREAFAGIAQAAAVVPMEPRFDGETTINVGAATYGGQSALGLALSHQIGRAVLNAGVGFSGKRNLVRVGLGWRF